MMKITRTQNNELNNAINTASGYIASVDGSLFETNKNAIIGSIMLVDEVRYDNAV